MKLRHFKLRLSLKHQLLSYFILVALVPTSIISAYYYYNSISVVKRNTGENNYKVISHIMDNIDKQVEQANVLSDWIYLNKDTTNLLKRSSAEIDKYDITKKQAVESIARQFQYMPVTNYILSLFLIGNNGLDIRNGTEASLINPDDFIKSEWFMKAKSVDDKVFWGGISKNYTKISTNKYVTPQYRAIKNLDNGKILGYSVMFFNEKFFSDCYKEVLLNKGEKIYLIDQFGNIISTNQPVELESNIRDKQYFEKLLQNDNQQYFQENVANRINLITYKKSSKTGWILVEIVPMTQIQEQKNIIGKSTVILIGAVVLMCVFLSFFLSDNFTSPIKMLVKQVNEIAHGNFNNSVALNISSEISTLSKSITRMQMNINDLLRESIQKEKEKRIAEIRMLQSQINPHFLYNSLNSIKLMATLQGAKGIENMVTALGRLLKAALSGIDEKIPLCEEIRILEDYIHIQRIQRRGKISFRKNIGDEDLLNCLIIKFILQPIVENTIIHGIDPKDEIGEIIISIMKVGGNLTIEVWDNGIGMSEEKIKIIQENSDIRNISYRDKGIGLNNINQRIKLVYGEDYGLSFESRVGEYTKITAIIPIEFN